MGALGFYNSGNKYSYKGATPLTDAMFGIRYIISNDEIWGSNLSLCEQTENKYIMRPTESCSWLYGESGGYPVEDRGRGSFCHPE